MFNLKIITESKQNDENGNFCLGEITVNDFQENFRMALDYWSPDDYLRQWNYALARILKEGSKETVFLSTVPNPLGPCFGWLLYPEEKDVFIQEKMFLNGEPAFGHFHIDNVYNHIGERDTTVDFDLPDDMVFEEGVEFGVSEWKTSLADLEDFANKFLNSR